ncbi:MAG: phenylacetate--CoA ligase family protein [Clostridiaceae bacterium]|nr:phenylacetate--CoA ligase family protein [Clostridiaceae bacterium]
MSLFRNSIYNIYDFLQGSYAKKNFGILQLINSRDSDSEQMTVYNNEQIQRVMQYLQDVPYYQDINTAKALPNTFFELPVVNKEIIRKNYAKFISRKFSDDKLVVRKTSGSSGTPFVVKQDIGKRRKIQAEVTYYYQVLGCKPGDPLIIFRATTERTKISKISRYLMNYSEIDVRGLDDNSIRRVLEILSKSKSALCVGYSSTLDAIGDYFDRNGYPEKGAYNLKGFISTSEALKEQTRIAIEKAFECPCISRYSNMEQGIIAQEISGYQGHIINEAHYLVELLKIDQDLPAVDGEVGRIVITDYFNAGMPFVRYDTGDLGILGYVEIDGNRKRCVKSIEGRITDVIFDINDQPVSPHQLSVSFWDAEEISQFQFIQTAKGEYLVKLILKYDSQINEKKLKQRLLDLLGEDSKIRFEIVSKIEVLASGKRKYIINQMKDNKYFLF